MGLKHPAITARIDNSKCAYLLKSYNIMMERQRPTIAEFSIDEPIDIAETAFLSLGFENELKEKCSLRILECNQITPHLFECLGIDPCYYILNDGFNDHGTRLSFKEALTKITSKYGLTLDIRTDKEVYKRQNLIFLGTVRNALDQIMIIYKVTDWRYHFDLLNNKLYILPGKLPVDPVELGTEYFLEENPEKGLEFKIFPEMSPFVPITWRGKVQIVDSVEFDSEDESMFLGLETSI